MFNLNISHKLSLGVISLSFFFLSKGSCVPIVLSQRTWKRIERLLNEGAQHGTDVGPNRAGRGARWVIVRCESVTPDGVDTGTQLDQLYPATIIFLSADVDYPPLGAADETVIGDPCLLTVLGTDPDTDDCPSVVAPIAGRLYAGQLTAAVELDPAVTGLVRARRRVVAVDIYAAGDVFGPPSSQDNELVRFDGATGKRIQGNTVTPVILEDSGELKARNTIWSRVGATANYVSMGGSAIGGSPGVEVSDGSGNKLRMGISAGSAGISTPDSIGNFGTVPLSIVTGDLDFTANSLTVDGAIGPPHVGQTGTIGIGATAYKGVIDSLGSGTPGAGTVTSVSGGSTGLTVNDPTTTPTLAGILNLASGGTGSLLADPAADAFMGWDDSAGATIFFAPDASLVFSGTGVGVGEIDLGTW